MLKLPSLNGSGGLGPLPDLNLNSPLGEESRPPMPGTWVGPLPGSMKPVGFQEQGSKAVEGAATGKYRSSAIHCEVKLVEALARGKKKDDAEGTRPDQFRTTVCVQMLNELCQVCGPFEHVLTKIKDELVQSIYSDYYASGDGSLSIEQTPFFAVVGRLEQEKQEMIEERERFRQELLERAEDIGEIEQRMVSLEEAVAAERTRNSDLSTELEQSNEKLARAKAEARQTKDELKRLRKDLLRAKEDMQRIRQNSTSQVELEELEQLRQTNLSTQKELTKVLQQLEAERAEKRTLVPQHDLDAKLAEVDELKDQLEAAWAAAGVAKGGGAAKAGALTPRPDWEEDCRPPGLSAQGKSTEEVVKAMCAKLLELEQKRDEEAQNGAMSPADAARILAPEPDPSQAASLDGIIKQVNEVYPEGSEVDKAARVDTLGDGPTVPRYLRLAGRAAFTALTKEATEQLVQDVWAAKAELEHRRRLQPTNLQEYMYTYLSERHGSQLEVASAGYSMVVALSRFSYDADIELFHRVLLGQVSEEVLGDRERMVSGLIAALARVDQGGTGAVELKVLQKVLIAYFPTKMAEAISALVQTIKTDDTGVMVHYRALLASDEEDTVFMDTLMDQHIAEISAYVSGLEEALLRLPEEPTLSALRSAIQAYDETKPAAEVEAYLMRGARLGSLSDLQHQIVQDTTIPVKDFVARLKTGLVKNSRNYDYNKAVEASADVAASGAVSAPGLPEAA